MLDPLLGRKKISADLALVWREGKGKKRDLFRKWKEGHFLQTV